MTTSEDRPNILFITTDMQRHDALGSAGNPAIQTPHLDALASRGVQFTQAFVNSPVCMPSRASLFTGKLPSAHGVRWNVGGLAAHEAVITRRLHDAGYLTAALGKMHWGNTDADFGLDHWNVIDGSGTASPGVPTYREHLQQAGLDHVPPVDEHPEYRDDYGAVSSPLPPEHHLDGFVSAATIEFLRNRDRQRPFFCWCSFHGPHLPIDPASPWDELYDPRDVPLPVWADDEFDTKPPEQRAFQRHTNRGNGFGDYRKITEDPDKLRRFIAYYWGKISMIDHFIGQIRAQLAEGGDLENTVVIFTSDHGDFVGNHRLLFKSAFLYDDLVRVPLIVSCPARWKPAIVDAFVEEIDLPATMLGLAGLSPHQGMQGTSLLPLLTGREPPPDWRDAVYAEAVDHRMIRTETWKLVHYCDKPYGELYDLRADPHELVNRYDDPTCASEREALQRKLIDRVIEMESRLHAPLDYIYLDDPEHPDSVDQQVKLPFI